MHFDLGLFADLSYCFLQIAQEHATKKNLLICTIFLRLLSPLQVYLFTLNHKHDQSYSGPGAAIRWKGDYLGFIACYVHLILWLLQDLMINTFGRYWSVFFPLIQARQLMKLSVGFLVDLWIDVHSNYKRIDSTYYSHCKSPSKIFVIILPLLTSLIRKSRFSWNYSDNSDV